jgi:hypothetical protein
MRGVVVASAVRSPIVDPATKVVAAEHADQAALFVKHWQSTYPTRTHGLFCVLKRLLAPYGRDVLGHDVSYLQLV